MSEVIVLDTHIWLWLVNANFAEFPSHWRDRIESAARVGISPVSCYEIAMAHQKGRIKISTTPQAWFQQALDPVGIELFPLTANIAARAVELSPVHKDPFDRLIIATALEYGAKLASVDGLFSQYSELENYLLK
ncbi:type II toxin-antitoxin system VapC family toxin [Chamaesiphon polymorphus]|uniref:PIN domain nuclease n=1 Tax=Chamaesiphon polymorphus CCALA 037 TaxID=2107692 RepID=A0A2T1GJN1_9CYAN|nr:type II toxin-antitoxin system VapC family toxin [Chamaesiphon polymorphus]PSB58005.1 PIN domain nuclease [Chamaesiphon polymorphus CCALA 037]